MAQKFLVKNVSSHEGIYSYQGEEVILQKGAQVYLDFPPSFYSHEIKVVPVTK